MPGYKVTDTREIARMSEAGTVVKVYRVWIITGKGASGTIDVPPDKWNKDDLPDILAEKAGSLDLAFAVSE